MDREPFARRRVRCFRTLPENGVDKTWEEVSVRVSGIRKIFGGDIPIVEYLS